MGYISWLTWNTFRLLKIRDKIVDRSFNYVMIKTEDKKVSRMTKFLKIIALNIFIITVFSVAFGQEQITITTYYPSPYGSYRELGWGNYPNTKGTLKADQGSSIELGGSGTPHIDFFNNMSSNYNARIILAGDNELRIDGITRINTCTLVAYGVSGITYCPNCYYVTSLMGTPTGYMVCCMVGNPPGGSGC